MNAKVKFPNRREAGGELSKQLLHYRERSNAVVLALPRGGVPVGFEVARGLRLPLDIFIVRKLGVPGHEELALGALASGGVRVVNADVLRHFSNGEELVEQLALRESAEIQRRERAYRGSRAPLDVKNRTVIVVDDGLATGSTMRAAVLALRQAGAGEIVVAVPVGSSETCAVLRSETDEMICLLQPPDFFAVGQYYESFGQTTDEEVRQLLADAQHPAARTH